MSRNPPDSDSNPAERWALRFDDLIVDTPPTSEGRPGSLVVGRVGERSLLDRIGAIELLARVRGFARPRIA